MDNVSYALGLGIGSQLKSMGAESLNIDDFAQAIKDVLNDSELKISMADSQKIVQKFFQEQEAKQRAAMAETGKKLKAEGEAYLAENAKKDGVITTASGLQYTVLKEGTGKSPKAIIDDYLIHEIELQLKSTDNTVQEIAYRFGFSSQAHFTKFFKKLKGVSPTEFRKGEKVKK